MDWKTNAGTIGRGACAALLSGALVVGAVPMLAGPPPAEAAELGNGQWQTFPTPTYLKLAGRVDGALAAQDPQPKVKTTTSKSKKYKTVTVRVSCKALKAGIRNAKDKKARAHASMSMKLYADNLYRSEKNESRVSCTKTVHGFNVYGKDRATDYSLYVGQDGTAEVYVRYEGLLGLYKNGTFRKANFEREIYWRQTKRLHVASAKIPKGYRLKLSLAKR